MTKTFNQFEEELREVLTEASKREGTDLLEKIMAYKKELNGELVDNKDIVEVALTNKHILYLNFINYNISDDKKHLVMTYSILGLRKFKETIEYARGLVVDTTDFKVVIRPFDKFYNVGEGNMSEKRLDTILKEYGGYAVNKLDGSISNNRYIEEDNGILTSSKGSLSQKIQIWEGVEQINHNIEAINKLTPNIKKMMEDYSEYTFMFENIIYNDTNVVNYSKEDDGLYLIGARNMNTMSYMTQPMLDKLAKHYSVAREFSMEVNSMEDVNNILESEKYKNLEGLVIYDNTGNIFKIKQKNYLTYHKLIYSKMVFTEKDVENLPTIFDKPNAILSLYRGVIKLVLQEDYDDYLPVVESKETLLEMIDMVEKEILDINKQIGSLKEMKENKHPMEFHEYLKNQKFTKGMYRLIKEETKDSTKKKMNEEDKELLLINVIFDNTKEDFIKEFFRVR